MTEKEDLKVGCGICGEPLDVAAVDDDGGVDVLPCKNDCKRPDAKEEKGVPF